MAGFSPLEHDPMRRFALVLSLVLLSGCDQETQTLPFSTTAVEPVTGTIQSGPTTITNPAGLSVTIPSGIAPSGTQVTLRPVATAPTLPSGMEAIGQAYELEFSNPVPLSMQTALRVSTEGLSQEDLVRVVPVIVPMEGTSGASTSLSGAAPPSWIWFGPQVGWESPVTTFFEFTPLVLLPQFIQPMFTWVNQFDFESNIFGMTVSVGPFGGVTLGSPGGSGSSTNRSLGDGRWSFSCVTAVDTEGCLDSGITWEADQELLDRYPGIVAGAAYIDAEVAITGSSATVNVDYDLTARAPIGATFTGKRFKGDYEHTGPISVTPATPTGPGTVTAAGRTYKYEFDASGSGFTLIVEETIELANSDDTTTPAKVKVKIPMTPS